MKDDTLILLGLVGVGGYFLYKEVQKVADIPKDTAAAAGQFVSDTTTYVEKTIENTITNTIKGVDDTLKGGAAAVQDTINFVGNIPRNLTPPTPQYIQDAVTQELKNKNITTDFKPKIVVSNPANPLNDLTISLATQNTGYLAPVNFDQPLQISTILQRTPAVITGKIAPKVIDYAKTYEGGGVPYATIAQQTGQDINAAMNSIISGGVKLTAVGVAPTSSVAPSKSTATTGTTSSSASTNAGAHYVSNLGVWVDNKTAKIVGKKAVGVWK